MLLLKSDGVPVVLASNEVIHVGGGHVKTQAQQVLLPPFPATSQVSSLLLLQDIAHREDYY